MMRLHELLHEYGAAIGPSLAFMLGLVTLWIKHYLDNRFARRDAERRVARIVRLIERVPEPPRTPALSVSSMAFNQALLDNSGEQRVAEFAGRLSFLRSFLMSSRDYINAHATFDTITKVQLLDYWLAQTINQLDRHRGDKSLHHIRLSWYNVLLVCRNRDPDMNVRDPFFSLENDADRADHLSDSETG